MSRDARVRRGSLISVVVPVFNEQENLQLLIRRMRNTLENNGIRYEMLFIDDASIDNSLAYLESESQNDDRINIVSFGRNFGHQMAVTAGLEHARGAAVAVIDADLQDPPELLVDMIRTWEGGTDVIMTRRRTRAGETLFKRTTANLFYRGLAKMTDTPIELDAGDFYLLDRQVVDVLNACPERARFLRGLVAWAGFKKDVIVYDRAKRHQGKSNYNLKKMLVLAKDALFSFSGRPIAAIHLLTALSMSISAAAIVYAIVTALNGLTVPGWATLIILMSVFGGLILLSIGIVAEYVFRVFAETQGRPRYVIRRYIIRAEREENNRVCQSASQSAGSNGIDQQRAAD